MASGWFESMNYKVINIDNCARWWIFDHDFFKDFYVDRVVDLTKEHYGVSSKDQVESNVLSFESYKKDPEFEVKELVCRTTGKENDNEYFFKGYGIYNKKYIIPGYYMDGLSCIYIFKNDKYDIENFVAFIER